MGKRRWNRTVKQALAHRSWVRDISGAPTEPVLCDYVLLWEKLERVHLQPMVSDRFVWKWTGDGNYLASLAYRSFFIGRTLLVGAQHLWHAHAPPKVKFFFWVSLHGRLWTAERRKRHGLQQDASCALCAHDDETTDHLLCSCVFAREVWHRLLHAVGWQSLTPNHNATLGDRWQLARIGLPGELRRAFDSAVLLATWNLWKEHNRRTFDVVSKTPLQLFHLIVDEADARITAGLTSLVLLVAARAS